jgi:outer membrane receptor protein involved in Fe transport
LVEKFDDDNELNLSYSRRINRPNPRQIIPFPNYSNPNSLFIGNPSIRPEYISSVEFGYSKKIGNLTLQPALFYRLTTDAIRPYTAVIDKNHVVSFAVNLSKNTAEGLEMVAMYQVFKFWNINFSGTIYNQTIYSGNLNDPSLINEINLYLPLKYKIDSSDVKPVASQKNAFSWDGKIISSTYLPLGFGLQISGFYRSPFITPQGTSQPFYSVNIGLKKDVLKGKGTFTISASDIFNTMKFEIQSNSSNLIADSWRKRESRIVYAGFTYRFGKVKQSKKPKKENVDEGAPQDDLMY